MTEQLRVGKERVVSIQFVLRDEDNNILDQSEEGDPLVYLHDSGSIVPGLEQALEGKAIGDKVEVKLNAQEGYGEYDEELCCTVPRNEFPENSEIEVGAMFEVTGPDGEMMVAHVTEVEGDDITLDGNHPLAGQTLNFAVQVVAVRKATSEELEHGHAHEDDDDCHTH